MSKQQKPRGKSLIGLIIAEQYRRWQNKRAGGGYRHKNHIPLMRERELLVLEELLSNLQPSKCLEWGSGYSTLYYPKFTGPGSTWTAVEHHPEWAERINGFNSNPGVNVVPILPEHEPWSDADDHNDGTYSDLKSYIEYPGDGAPYDFILVDGRARVECLNKAFEWVADDGVVVLHDAMRPWYHEPLVPFAHQASFPVAGKLDQGLWLGSKGSSIGQYLNVERHQKLWKMHNDRRRKRDDLPVTTAIPDGG